MGSSDLKHTKAHSYFTHWCVMPFCKISASLDPRLPHLGLHFLLNRRHRIVIIIRPVVLTWAAAAQQQQQDMSASSSETPGIRYSHQAVIGKYGGLSALER
eukprot:220575-Pelagomonas_calceolata.AAC.2